MGYPDGRKALAQPLTSRPGYGEGDPALPRGSVGESKLPSGPPAGKGVGLDPDIPGTRTFAKPTDDVRDFDKSEEGSIYERESPDQMAKPQDDADPGDERDHSEFKPTSTPPGGRPEDDNAITKYPYRDGIPNRHNASAEFVAGLWALRFAHEIVIEPSSLFETRTAARMEEILSGLNPKVQEKARSCTVSLKRADKANLRWLFSVDCGNGAKVVKMKATRKGNVTRIGRMDLTLSCSCPAWRWLGSEHHSQRDDYLDGKPRGTAAAPMIKDPEGINRVCKHVTAVLSFAKGWEIPAARKKSR